MKRIILAIVTVCCLVGCSHGDRKYLLRLKYKAGDQVDLSYHVYMVKNGDENNPITNTIIRMSLKVDSVIADSLYSFSAKVDYERTEVNGVREPSSYPDGDDDDDADNNSGAKQRSRLRHRSSPVFKMMLNDRGVVVKPLVFAGESAAPINYSFCQVVFPVRKVSDDDDWSTTVQLPTIKGTKTSEYHIEGIYTGKIQISESGTITSENEGQQKFTARYVIDQKTNMLISVKIEMESGGLFRGKTKLVVDVEAKNWGFM